MKTRSFSQKILAFFLSLMFLISIPLTAHASVKALVEIPEVETTGVGQESFNDLSAINGGVLKFKVPQDGYYDVRLGVTDGPETFAMMKTEHNLIYVKQGNRKFTNDLFYNTDNGQGVMSVYFAEGTFYCKKGLDQYVDFLVPVSYYDSGNLLSYTISVKPHDCETYIKEQRNSFNKKIKEATRKATFYNEGSSYHICPGCNGELAYLHIPQISAITYNNKKIYNGNRQPVGVLVNAGSNTGAIAQELKYSIKYLTNATDIGTHKLNVIINSDSMYFTGQKTLTYDILPPAVQLSAIISKSKGAITFKTKYTYPTKITKYEYEICTNKKFTNSTKGTLTPKGISQSKTVKKLKSKKTYYVRIRAYKQIGNKKYYSAWSKTYSVKTK